MRERGVEQVEALQATTRRGETKLLMEMLLDRRFESDSSWVE
jgi:hypothetical protein